ncbi:multidrug transporter [Skermanella stibiiresistens SB22]|uniref:Multidrug transporter n=1 Tax=Skermanella stibiiresistens SB22 TaxID=1385369 RepID=W9GSU2_9PROT|nr:MATE family efflux transporter [Skermanella stibiiresistens]EWY36824.1 multidrug transporter [Skermanella stibiiresistens SB22]
MSARNLTACRELRFLIAPTRTATAGENTITTPQRDTGNTRSTLRHHLVELLRLALPVIVARAGLMVMSAVDILIVGRHSSRELAYLGLGTLPAQMLVTTGIGLLLGTLIMTSQAVGAGRLEDCGVIWRRSLPYAVLLGLAATVLSLLSEPFFQLTGQDPDVARGGAGVAIVLAVGIPAAMLYTTTAFFLEGLKRPVPGMVAMIIANLLNVPLNVVLVWGAWGIPAMGAEGSAWATTTVRWLLALSLMAYVWHLRDRETFGVRRAMRGWWNGAERQRRLGYAAGISLTLESSAFSILGLFAGMVGPLDLGAYTIVLNLIALSFMTAVGLATATGVRVGVAYGRRDRREIMVAGWMGLGVTTALLAAIAVLFALMPKSIGGLFTSDANLLAITVPLIAYSAFILIADGGQVVMASALRGQSDAWVPTVLHFISYYGVMIPVGGVLALWADRGVGGLLEGILIASVVSVAVLSTRFHLLSRA